MKTNSKTARSLSDQHLLAGLATRFATTDTLTINADKLTVAEIGATLKARIDATVATVKARAATATALEAERSEITRTAPTVRALRQLLYAMFGSAPDVLSDFGLPPRKTTTLTATERVAAQAKAKATRAARHTMGSRQKAKVKGEGPETAPASPVPVAVAPGASTPTASVTASVLAAPK